MPFVGVPATYPFQCQSDKYTIWFFEKKKLPPNSIVLHFTNSSTLTIGAPTLQHYGKYQCFGWNAEKRQYFLAEGKIIVHGESAW